MQRNQFSHLWLLGMLMSVPAMLVASCPAAPHSTGLEAVELSPDGTTIAVAATDGTVFSWDVKSGKRTTLIDCLSVSTVAFSPDSSRVALADADGGIKVFDLLGQRLTQSIRANTGANDGANTNAIERIVFSGDGSRLAAQDFNGIRLLSTESGKEILSISAERRVEQIALSHDGALLARGGYGSLALWDVAKNRAIRTMALQTGDFVESIVFARDDRWLISALAGRGIVVWDTETGNRVSTLQGQTGHLDLPLIITVSGSLFTAADDGTLRSWDLDTGRMNSTWETSPGFISSNGQLVLKPVGPPGQVELWRIGSPIKEAKSFVYKSPLCVENLSASKEAITEKQLDTFRNVGMGESRAGDGTQLSFTTYLAPDCKTMSITHGEFGSAASAKEELEHRIRRAMRVIEQGPNKDSLGKTIGERAVLVLDETDGTPTTSAVVWTEGNRYAEIQASSLPLVQALERRHRH